MEQEYYSIDEHPEVCAQAVIDLVKADIKVNPKVFRYRMRDPELKNTKWADFNNPLKWTMKHGFEVPGLCSSGIFVSSSNIV